MSLASEIFAHVTIEHETFIKVWSLARWNENLKNLSSTHCGKFWHSPCMSIGTMLATCANHFRRYLIDRIRKFGLWIQSCNMLNAFGDSKLKRAQLSHYF